jgi:hypothetical protein
LATDKRQVSFEEGQAMANEKDFIFNEVSAKEGTNINKLFYEQIFEKISKKFGIAEPEDEKNQRVNTDSGNKKQGTIKIGNKKEVLKPKRKCCK